MRVYLGLLTWNRVKFRFFSNKARKVKSSLLVKNCDSGPNIWPKWLKLKVIMTPFCNLNQNSTFFTNKVDFTKMRFFWALRRPYLTLSSTLDHLFFTKAMSNLGPVDQKSPLNCPTTPFLGRWKLAVFFVFGLLRACMVEIPRFQYWVLASSYRWSNGVKTIAVGHQEVCFLVTPFLVL